MALAETIVSCFGVYFIIGAVVAILFLTFGVSRIDEAAKGASRLFRPTIFFGCVVLWPFVILRMLSMKKINKPIEDHE